MPDAAPIDLAAKRLEAAAPPAKERMLKMLDILREEVERGEVVALFAISIRVGMAFDTTYVGDLTMATLAGMLGRAQLDALEGMRR